MPDVAVEVLAHVRVPDVQGRIARECRLMACRGVVVERAFPLRNLPPMLLRFPFVCALLAALARAAAAQDVNGTVLDSASGIPIAGAVVIIMSAAGTTMGRTITSERGRYRLAVSADAERLQFLRIGFRPLTVPVPTPVMRAAPFDARMTSLASLLSDVRVGANRQCGPHPDREDAHALWK